MNICRNCNIYVDDDIDVCIERKDWNLFIVTVYWMRI